MAQTIRISGETWARKTYLKCILYRKLALWRGRISGDLDLLRGVNLDLVISSVRHPGFTLISTL
jgi:hypothetical protein